MISSGYRLKVKMTGSAIGLHAKWKRESSKMILTFMAQFAKNEAAIFSDRKDCRQKMCGKKEGGSGVQLGTRPFLWRRLVGSQIYESGLQGRCSGRGADLETE